MPATMPGQHQDAVGGVVRFLAGAGASDVEVADAVAKIKAASRAVADKPIVVGLTRWGIDVHLHPAPHGAVRPRSQC